LTITWRTMNGPSESNTPKPIRVIRSSPGATPLIWWMNWSSGRRAHAHRQTKHRAHARVRVGRETWDVTGIHPSVGLDESKLTKATDRALSIEATATARCQWTDKSAPSPGEQTKANRRLEGNTTVPPSPWGAL
jgi:hypothetical protein